MRPDISVRLAVSDDAADVKRLAFEAGFKDPGIDWSDLYPYWLIAEYGGNIVGILQVCPSRPIGRLEMLHIVADVPDRVRPLAAYALLETGRQTLKGNGAQYVSGVIAFENKVFKKFMRKRGAVTAATGNLMIWKV